MKQRTKILISVIIPALLIGSFLVFQPKSSFAKELISTINSIDMGTFFKGKERQINSSLENLNSVIEMDNLPSDVIATVNGLPITLDEFDLRITMIMSGGLEPDETILFNKLVEEKAILDFANKHGLKPSDKEIQSYLQDQKNNYADPKGKEYKEIVDAFVEQANISLDYYWNNFVYYNLYRGATITNVANYYIEEAKKEGKLSKEPSLEERKNAYKPKLIDIKKQAEVKVNKTILQNKGWKLDVDQFYLPLV